jgi:hypothetical protein
MSHYFALCLLCVFTSVNALAQYKDSSIIRNRLYPHFDENFKGTTSVRVQVSDSAALSKWMKDHPRFTATSHGHNIHTIKGVSNKEIIELLQIGVAKYIDRAERHAREETVLGDFDMALNTVSKLQSLKPELDGHQVIVSIKEKPFDVDDLDLRGRIMLNDQFDEPSSLHATIMATVVAGAGNTSSEGKGVAPAARVTTSDFASLLPDDAAQMLASGISVQNHSYGVGVENYYGIESAEYDRSVYENPAILHVFSSGNDGGQVSTSGYYANIPGVANLTGQFKVSKNSISVGSSDRYGNVVTRSSRGPAHDGRVKPELIAYGDAGSSEACALVSGIATLIQDQFLEAYGNLPDAALVKGLLINGAVDTGREQVDFETGYGNVNALNSIRAIEDERFFSGSVSQGNEITFDIDVPANVTNMKATLVWTDPGAQPFAEHTLINNLDFEIISPSQELYLPWILNVTNSLSALQAPATRGVDNLNNVEQITISNPTQGLHTLKVKGSTVNGSQKFFIVYDFRSGFEWLSPTVSDPSASAINNILHWSWDDDVSIQGVLSFRYANDIDWQVINEAVTLSQKYYEWMAPDTSALVQFKFVTENEEYLSEVTLLDSPQRLKVGFNCDDQVMFYWRAVPSATSYTLYGLEEKYMEPVLTTTDTFALLNKPTSNNHYAVASVFENLIGKREATIDYNVQGVGCYFKTFLPRSTYIFDTSIFDVSLGTIYNLKSAELQILKNGVYETVDLINNINQTDFSFVDNTPRRGNQTYRAKLLTVDGNVIYSEEVGVLFISASDVYVYPNPVSAGEDVSVIVQSEESAVIEFFDTGGAFVSTAEDFGIVKTVSTSGLKSGVYILKVKLSNGAQRHGRVIVK